MQIPARKKVPLLSHASRDDKHQCGYYEAYCFPPGYKSHELYGLSPPERVARLLAERGTPRAFELSKQRMNVTRGKYVDFTEAVPLPGLTLLRSEHAADVIEIRRGEALWFRSNTGMLVVATGDDRCIAGYTDATALVEEGETRMYPSTVHAIRDFFDRRGVDLVNVVLHGFFNHPQDIATKEGFQARARSEHIRKPRVLKELRLENGFAYPDHPDPELARAENDILVCRPA